GCLHGGPFAPASRLDGRPDTYCGQRLMLPSDIECRSVWQSPIWQQDQTAGLEIAMVWKPGQSGNPVGKKPGTLKEKPYRDALRMEIAAGEDFKGLRAIARAHLEKARSGDMAAIKELGDRLDGRPAQESNVSLEHRTVTELTTEELMAIAA